MGRRHHVAVDALLPDVHKTKHSFREIKHANGGRSVFRESAPPPIRQSANPPGWLITSVTSVVCTVPIYY